MTRAEYEDRILRLADRIRERRAAEDTARAYVAAKKRIDAGTASWIEEYYEEIERNRIAVRDFSDRLEALPASKQDGEIV